ncbi:MAG: ATP-dependent DNA helicase RecQ, partial [Saprospiraceae bacterium]
MTPQEVLKKFWGFDNFRSMQLEIIKSVLDGKDTLALLPTGGGKSICFQIPALCQEGICIVVSPLIALMKDQVHNLNKRGIPAVAIYSGMHYREIDRVFDNCAYGKIKFLYLSPERLMTDLAQERIKKMNVNLIAIDEAHCISQWGYDFRPPYLEIAKIRILHPKVPFLALTATATPEVVTDIQERLEFKTENVFQKSFRRDNLAYVVLNDEGKLEKMLSILQKVKGSSVVYVRNRKKTKEAAQFLQLNNIYADFYHAGLTNDVRSKKQDAWINNQTRVMVSTNAFGMGIDKPDVRTVIHLTLPDSLEAYFQEAGRAGRDGNRAFSILLYSETDKVELERQFEQSYPAFSEIKQVYRALGSYFQLAIGSGLGESFDFDLIEFCRHYKFKVVETFNALKILMHEGWLFMTEAVYVPSSLMVKATKEDLYDYKLRNKGFENLITTILRTYQ